METQLLETDAEEQAYGLGADALGQILGLTDGDPELGVAAPKLQALVPYVADVAVVIQPADGELAVLGVDVFDLRLDEGPGLFQGLGP